MDSKKKLRRPVQSSSSSSSEDSSFSSSSDDVRKKQKRRNYSSSSSEEEKVRKTHKHKKSSVKKHSHSAKLRDKMTHGKKAPRSMSPATKAAHKHKLKLKKAKYAQEVEHDRRSRSPTRRNVKKERTPEHKIASPTTRIRVSIQNNRAIQERSTTRTRKESPISSRRREQVAEKERMELSRQEALKESERLKRVQEEEQRYKRLKKHHHEQSPSPARGKISILDRLDGGYNPPRRSISRDVAERDDYMVRERETYDRPEPERNYEYREREEERVDRTDRDRRFEYSSSSRAPYEEQPPQRHHRHHYNEPEPRDVEPRGRVYESRRRFPEDNPPFESNYEKWPKDELPMRPSWKDSAPPSMHPRAPPPKRFPYSSHSSSGPSNNPPHGGFKPRFSGSSPHFQKRFPYQPRYPNQYSKINYSKRNLPPTATETSAAHSSGTSMILNEPKHEQESQHQQQPPIQLLQQQPPTLPVVLADPIEKTEIVCEQEEIKVEADTTTMSGNVDTQSQEECEGNLSEFSDIDDEILNREEELNQNAHLNAIKQEQLDQEDEADEKELKIISKIHANNELKREMDLDFEEISDGELEEESRLKTIGDALGVDWESLAKETQKPLNRISEISTTKSRLTSHRILWDIGVSAKILGEETAREILTNARDKLRSEKAAATAASMQLKIEQIKKEDNINGDVKLEVIEQNGDEENGNTEEIQEQTVNKNTENPSVTKCEIEQDFELDDDVLPHPLASIQVLTRQMKMKRNNLILSSSCKYGRALSAKKDMRIRRELCRLPPREIKVDRSCAPNPELRKNIFEIYKRIVDNAA